MVAQYAARFSVRALEVSVDTTVLWVGAGLAIGAAVLLAYVPRLPSVHAPAGLGLAAGAVRITPGTHRRLRVFATPQIHARSSCSPGRACSSPRSWRCRARRPG
jgi:hypothetical protein